MIRILSNLAVKLAVVFPVVLGHGIAEAQQLPNTPRATCYAKDIFEARVFPAIRQRNHQIVTSYSSDRGGNVLLYIEADGQWEMWGLMKMNQSYCLITAGEGRFIEGLPQAMTAKVEG